MTASTSRSSFLAALLSIVPGLGQLYKGRLLSAIIWFIAVSCLYSIATASILLWIFLPLALLLHLACIMHAFMLKA